MALINCTECGSEVSDKAAACPKCGAPLEKLHESKEKVNSKETKNETTVQEPKKKNNVWKIIVAILIVILSVFVFFVLQNSSNPIPEIKLEINPPSPLLITSRADEVNSTLFKRKVTVYATVQNQGGEGNVLVTFTVSQAGKDYTRSQSVFMRPQESIDIEETFTEVKMLDGQITFDVNVKGQ